MLDLRPRLSPSFSLATLVVALAALYLLLRLGFVVPYQWPAGPGLLVDGGPPVLGGSLAPAFLLGRPPAVGHAGVAATRITEVAPASPAERAGLRAGDRIVALRNVSTNARVDLRPLAPADAPAQLRVWRDAYRLGVRGPFEATVERGSGERTVMLDSTPAWSAPAPIVTAWARNHVSPILQIVVFVGISTLLLALRASDRMAALSVLALSLCGVYAGGPLMGGEYLVFAPLRELMLVFTWMGTPLSFIATAFAILYFPRQSKLLSRRPWVHVVPFVIAGPMLVVNAVEAAFLIGTDAVLPLVEWEAAHPWLYFGAFATAVAMNVAVMGEAQFRFRHNPDQAERRRIEIAVLTIVPGVLAFAIKDGVPAVSLIAGTPLALPWWLTLALQVVVLLPAFGLAYVVAVHRVFAPATVLRRSVQYAFARRTLTVLALLPGLALVVSLVRYRDVSIATLVTGQPLFYLLTATAVIVALRYRDGARLWLDRHFFREAYDAREILLSLASRITYETDPRDLTAMVVDRIDTALHPELVAVLIGGPDDKMLTPVVVLRGSAAPLPATSGLVTMLRWSDEPLELYVDDERSPARRLPAEDQQWLRQTRAVLFVPISSRGTDGTHGSRSDGRKELPLGLIALGARRSEEPYTAEDRQLLASIAAQMTLVLDVARLRQRLTDATALDAVTHAGVVPVGGLAECPECGRCLPPGAKTCPDDGTLLRASPTVPHVIDQKYRLDRLIGRGGMGAVYRARDVRLDRDVAIKVVRAELLDDPEARTRFRREAQIVARLQHPGIVSVFDYGTLPDGAAFLVMELVRGEDLRHVLRRDGALPASRVLPLVCAICAAVQAAHREGVLHRDLKPENILLLDGDASVKVLDFGVAKVLSDRASEQTALGTVTGTGVLLGTPAYMAPEQLRSQPVDARTDVFSLGVIAYEMLTGELPFGRASLWDIGARQASGMKPLRSPHGDLPPHLEPAIARALSVDPAERPASAMAFASELSGFG
jgi:tRNA A-37 threonylcarbamoyl transferase component Bud32/GAF domain-containing protein